MEEASLDQIATLRAEVLERAESGGDVRLHMERFFDTVLEFQPSLLVELGIRGGVSSFALERGARLVGARMICVDINDCSGVLGYAEFVQSDDVVFARRFRAFCRRRGIEPKVDLLMVDTSHTYVHTQQEIRSWLPLMSPRCLLMFHDTNASQFGYGVAAYLGEWLGIPFPENIPFTAESGPWRIEHNPDCFGLTILRRG